MKTLFNKDDVFEEMGRHFRDIKKELRKIIDT